VVLLALAPLFAVLGGSLMLELAVPVLSSLIATPGKIDPQAAMAFFMIAAVHAALMLLVLRVAGTIVSGWSVFGLANKAPAERGEPALTPRTPVILPPIAGVAVDQARGAAPSRSIRLAPPTPHAANDAGATVTTRRETRVVSGATAPAAPAPLASRTKGIGSRFRIVPDRRWETSK
jgi:type IV secretion system protein VirB6